MPGGSVFLLYARKSTETEDRQVQSIPDQIALADQAGRREGFVIAEVITESRSAKAQGTRPGFARMIGQIESEEANGIVAWHPDRLARNAVDGGWILDLLDRGKLKYLVFTSGYTFENTPEGKFMLGMIFSQSKYYVDKLSKDVRRGMDSKIATGWFPHRAPEGYVNDRTMHTVVPDEHRFRLLRRAWEMMLTGAYSGTQVRQALVDWGYRTRKTPHGGDQPPSVSGMYAMFDNPFYYGEFRHGGAMHKGAHEPMVTREEWERVQALLGRANHAQPKKNAWAYTGLIRCGTCGCLITAERKVKRYPTRGRTVEYVYYHCTGSRGCSKQSVSESYLDAEIAEFLERIRIRPEVLPWLLDVVARHCREEGKGDDSAQEMRAGAKRAMAAMRRRLDALFDMRAGGEITADEFQERKARVEAEIATAERAMEEGDSRQKRRHETAENALTFCATAFDRFTGGDMRARREVAFALDAECLLTLGKLQIRPQTMLAVLATFEPPETGSESAKIADLGVGDPCWQYIVENIRTAYDEKDGVTTGQ